MVVKSIFRISHVIKMILFITLIIIAFYYITLISIIEHGFLNKMSIIWYISLILALLLLSLILFMFTTVSIEKSKITLKRPLGKPKSIPLIEITNLKPFYSRKSGMSNSTGNDLKDSQQTLRIYFKDNSYIDINQSEYLNYNDLKNTLLKNYQQLIDNRKINH